MGWIYSHRPQGQSLADWLRDELPETHKRADVVRQVGSTFFIVARIPDGEWDEERNKTFKPCADGIYRSLLVILTQTDKGHYNQGYKDMDETMGPYEIPPPAILDMLSPLQDGYTGYAREFRERCRRYYQSMQVQKALLEPGTQLELDRSPEWSDGYRGTRYAVTSIKTRTSAKRSRTVLVSPEGNYYGVPKDLMNYGPRVVEAAL